jgi:hypothetical protein
MPVNEAEDMSGVLEMLEIENGISRPFLDINFNCKGLIIF